MIDVDENVKLLPWAIEYSFLLLRAYMYVVNNIESL